MTGIDKGRRAGYNGCMNKTRIADRTGYSRSHITRVLNGTVAPSVECLRAIAEDLNISMDGVMDIIETPTHKDTGTHTHKDTNAQ